MTLEKIAHKSVIKILESQKSLLEKVEKFLNPLNEEVIWDIFEEIFIDLQERYYLLSHSCSKISALWSNRILRK
jgi:hypothetical protein